MIVRVLGDVSLVGPGGEPVPLPGSRQAALLAALAARPRQSVSADTLVDLLWAEDPPLKPAAALHSAVFKLRASLDRVSDREVLHTRDRGYLLDLQPGDLDADVFVDLVQRARDEPPEPAAETLDAALRLWHGPAFGRFSETGVAHLEALRLDEQRRIAVERRGAALLAADQPAEAVALLRPFVAEQPLREAARITLMRALHAVGRTSDALEEYQVHRTHLADELGLEPSGALVAAQAELLRGDPDADATAERAGTPARPPGLAALAVRYLRTDAGSVLALGETGTGPKVVVLLGWISSLDVLASGRDPRSSLVDRLASHFSLTVYDRAGSGLSPGPIIDHGLEAAVEELREVVRDVGPPVSLLAMSSAGPIAVTLAHRQPEWVDSLVLFGTFADGPATFRDFRLYDMVVEIARSHWGVGSKMLADLYRPGISDQAAWHMAKMFRETASAEVAAAYLQAIYHQRAGDLLPSVTAPALVLHYRRDRLISFAGSEQLASGLPNATFRPLDGQFHLPDAADLDSIEHAVVEHVRRHASTG